MLGFKAFKADEPRPTECYSIEFLFDESDLDAEEFKPGEPFVDVSASKDLPNDGNVEVEASFDVLGNIVKLDVFYQYFKSTIEATLEINGDVKAGSFVAEYSADIDRY